MNILLKFSCDDASAISLLACPWGDSAGLGAAPTPTTTPASLLLMLLSATLGLLSLPRSCAFAHSTSGSCTKVSSTAINESLYALNTLRNHTQCQI